MNAALRLVDGKIHHDLKVNKVACLQVHAMQKQQYTLFCSHIFTH